MLASAKATLPAEDRPNRFSRFSLAGDELVEGLSDAEGMLGFEFESTSRLDGPLLLFDAAVLLGDEVDCCSAPLAIALLLE